MVARKINQERDIQIFKEWLEQDHLTNVGKAHGISNARVSTIVDKKLRQLRLYAVNFDLPAPGSLEKKEAIKNKTHWLDLLQNYEIYLEEEQRVEIDSPVRKLGINGMAVSKLNKLNIFTIADLLIAFKDDYDVMWEKLKYFYPGVRILEKKLTALGLDTRGGPEQKINQQQGE